MRTELYRAIGQRLQHLVDKDGNAVVDENNEPVIKHVDLWNRNVEFIEEDSPFPMPAVFVEFSAIQWTPVKTGRGESYRGGCQVRLHIVTQWKGSSAFGSDFMCQALADLELSKLIQANLVGLSGDDYCNFHIVETITNHDHEEIVESIDTYSVVCERVLTTD